MVGPTVTTDYCFTIADANGCIAPNSCVTITVTPPLDLGLTADLSICDGSSTDLIATAADGNGGPYTFTWTNQLGNGMNSTDTPTTSTVTVDPGTQQYYYVQLSDGCSTPVNDSVLVSINPVPQALLFSPDSTGCAPSTIQFIANTDVGTTFEFDVDCDGTPEYSGPNSTFSYEYTVPGSYDACLTVISSAGCDTSISVVNMVTIYEVPEAIFTPTPSQASLLSPMFTFEDNSIGGTHYDWNFGDGYGYSGPNDTIIDEDSITYGAIIEPTHTYEYSVPDTGYFDVTLTVTNEWGCTDQATEEIHIQGDYILFTPNSFTPNGDGVNDVWYPKGIGIDPLNYEMFIFNRWGQLIFESHNPSVGWDGTHKGKAVQIDAYVWIVRTKDHTNKQHEYMGHVSVVK